MSQSKDAATRQPLVTWPTSIGAGMFSVVAASAAVVAFGKAAVWSWPMFVWGVAIAPIWIVSARSLTRVMAASWARTAPPSIANAAQARAPRWRLWAPAYVGLVLTGTAVSIVAGGLDTPWPDAALTIAWVIVGVLLPLVLYRSLKARLKVDHSGGHAD